MNLNRSVAITALAIATLALVLSPWGQQQVQTLEQEASSALTAVGSAFQALMPTATYLGPLPASQSLDVGVGLPLTDSAALQSFIQSTETPNSPNFQKFLTPAAFDAQYAPSLASYDHVLSYFQSYGLDPQVSSNRLLLGLTGNSVQMGAAFGTTFASYSVDGSIYYGPTSTPQLPTDLDVSGSFGTTNLFNAHPAGLTEIPVVSSSTNSPSASCTGGDTPTEIKDAYRMNAVISAGYSGSGEKIAVVDTYDTSQSAATLTSDITSFDTACGVSAVTPQYQYPVHNWPTGNTSSGWGDEIALDMQWSHVQAESAGLYPTLTPDSGFSLYEGVNYLVANKVVDVISLSWGFPDEGVASGCSAPIGCNASTAGVYAVFHPVLQAAVAEGISVTVASGDCGADDGSTIPSTDYPSSDEDATGIGGSVLTLASNNTYYGSETGWSGNNSASSCGNQGGAGGGFSPNPQPWWQTGPGTKANGLRGVPDVGITVGTPLVTFISGAGAGVYGTSDGAPQWAGIIATADGMAGHDLGLINPALYAMLRNPNYGSSGGEYFHDYSGGNNGYKCATGWSQCGKGVGTPILTEVVPYLAGSSYLPPAGTLTASWTASTTSGSTPLSVTFTVTVTGGTGKYVLNYYWGDGTSDETKATTLAHTYSVAGTYAAQVEVYDSSGNSTTTPAIMITAGATSTLSLTLTASTTTPAVGASVTFTATTSGGKSPFDFGYFFGDGTWVFQSAPPYSTSPNTQDHAYGAAGVYCADATANDSSSPQMGATSSILTIDVGGATGTCAASPLTATASGTPTTGSAPLTVGFTGSGSGGVGPYTYAWRYGDGQTLTSGAADPTHTYNASGSFTARFWVNDSASHSATATVAITVSSSTTLTATASGTPLVGDAPLGVSFMGSASGGTPAYVYNWGFGDGLVATGVQDPTHTYGAAGTYQAFLYVNDSASHMAVSTAVVVVVSPALAASASGIPTSGPAPLDVTFSGGATGGVGADTYSWNFGDGSPVSTVQNPSHTYAAGHYNATLTVTDSNSDTSSASVAINVWSSSNSLTVGISSNLNSGTAPLAVEFTSTVSGGTPSYSYAWAFGDGGTSLQANPTYTYESAGTYQASVTVTDSATPADQQMSNALTITVSSTGGTLSVSASASVSSLPVGQTVTFSSVVSGGTPAYSYVWSGLPTGCASLNQGTLACTPTAAGSFSVTVAVTDASDDHATSTAVPVTVTASSPLTGSASVSASPVAVGTSVTFTAKASGGTSPYGYSWSDLPSGCTAANSATITCSPSSAGTYSVSVVISDSSSPTQTVTASVSLTVTGSSSAQGTVLGLSPLYLGLLLVIIVAAIVAVALLARHRKKKQEAPPTAWQAGAYPDYGQGPQASGGYFHEPPPPPSG